MDKRTYCEYYCSLIKRKQLLLFTFYTNDDYNLRCIKIVLFLFSFALDYTVNTLFFNDDTMHEIYEDEGKYNFLYQIPNILYSTLISTIIGSIIESLALSEDYIIGLRKYYSKKKDKNKKKLKPKTYLKIKFSFFCILNFLFLSVFWYYISCFGVVYKNTQIHIIKDTLISFILSLLYPIVECLLPGFFRIPSLRALKQDRECVYKFSQFLENFSFCLNDC